MNRLIALSLILLVGCGNDVVTGPRVNALDVGNEPNHTMDLVKLITPSITDRASQQTYFQASYTIASESRLLMRFKGLPSVTSRILADQPIYLRLSVAEGETVENASQTVLVCPLRSQWNMSATWTSSGLREDWTGGGDFDPTACVKSTKAPLKASRANVKATPESVGTCTTAGDVCFDVGAWYRDYVQKGSFDGLVVVASEGHSARIAGDSAGSKAPWLHWTEAVSAQ